MPTISQLVRKGRKPAGQKVKAPALRRTFNTLKQTASEDGVNGTDDDAANPFLEDAAALEKTPEEV